jgi:YHS domain-containing protein
VKGFHFIPTSASWLNAVEGLFAKLSRQRLPSMTVDPAKTRHRAEHAGHSYFFCGAKCREKFRADPALYIITSPRPFDAMISPRLLVWVQLILGTPAVLWGGWPFFQRGWASIVSRRHGGLVLA